MFPSKKKQEKYGTDFKKLKRRLHILVISIWVIVLIVCSLITFDGAEGYNIYFMPVIGAVGCIIFRKKWYIVPVIVFVIFAITMALGNLIEWPSAIFDSFTLKFLYAIASLLGCVIFLLLKYAFRREKRN